MRLHRLRLSHFRGVTDRAVEFAPDAATVILAANEAGKSSLFEALDLLFGLPDDSKAARLRAVRPAGQDVATEVEADLELGEQMLTYRKRWFRQRATELTVRPVAGGTSQSLTGREAHQHAAQLFEAEVDQSLWSALMTRQGAATTVPVAGSVAAVLTALDEADGGAVDHAAAAPVVDAVEAEYLRYFTPTGRPRGEHAAALARHERATAAVTEASSRLAETREDVTRAEHHQAELDALNRRLNDERAHVRSLYERRRATDELRRRVERYATETELATARQAAAEQAEQARQALVSELAEQQETVAAAAAASDRARSAVREQEREVEAARLALDEARKRQTTCRERVAAATNAIERRRDQAELADLEERLRRLDEAVADQHAADAALADNHLDEERLAEIEAAHRDVLAARAALAAGAPTVVVRRLGSAPVTVDRADPTGGPDVGGDVDGDVDGDVASSEDRHMLAPQARTELAVERPLWIRAEGTVEVEVQPGEGVAGLTAAVAEAERHEQDLLAAAGAADIAAARRLARERVEQERRRDQAQETIRGCGGDNDIEALRARRSALAARVAEADDGATVEAQPVSGEAVGVADTADSIDGPDTVYTVDTAEGADRTCGISQTAAHAENGSDWLEQRLAQAREDEAVAVQQAVEAERSEAAARKAYDAVAERATAERLRADHAREREAELAETLAAHRAETTDERLAECAQAARAYVEELANAHAIAVTELRDSGGEQVDADLEQAEAVVQRLQEQVEEVQDALRHVQGRLEMAGAHGLATQLEQAQAEQAEAERDRDRLVRRASAAARLHGTVERHRAQARSRYAAPLRERIERLGRVLHDPSFTVELGPELEVVSRELEGISLPVEALSLGAREQLAVLVRLAIAELTARDGTGVPVMLDDALGWSDPGRLRAMGQLLARAAERTQVVVLTCVPDRYVDVPGAQWSRW